MNKPRPNKHHLGNPHSLTLLSEPLCSPAGEVFQDFLSLVVAAPDSPASMSAVTVRANRHRLRAYCVPDAMRRAYRVI